MIDVIWKLVSGHSSDVIATVAAIFSGALAWVAWTTVRSSDKARFEQDQRQALTLAQNIASMKSEMENKGIDLHSQYQALASFTGNMNSSRMVMIKRAAEEKVEAARLLAKPAEEFLRQRDETKMRTNHKGLDRALADFSITQQKVLSLHRELSDELVGVKALNAEYRNRALAR